MGIMEKLVKKWLKVEINCEPSSIVSADIIDLASVFTLLILGVGVALMMLAIERLVSNSFLLSPKQCESPKQHSKVQALVTNGRDSAQRSAVRCNVLLITILAFKYLKNRNFPYLITHCTHNQIYFEILGTVSC